MNWIVLALLLWVSFFDALRDAWMREAGWWKRHLVKWASFYPAPAFVLFYFLPWTWWLPATALSWITWRLSVAYVGGRKWESWLTRPFKKAS